MAPLAFIALFAVSALAQNQKPIDMDEAAERARKVRFERSQETLADGKGAAKADDRFSCGELKLEQNETLKSRSLIPVSDGGKTEEIVVDYPEPTEGQIYQHHFLCLGRWIRMPGPSLRIGFTSAPKNEVVVLLGEAKGGAVKRERYYYFLQFRKKDLEAAKDRVRHAAAAWLESSLYFKTSEPARDEIVIRLREDLKLEAVKLAVDTLKAEEFISIDSPFSKVKRWDSVVEWGEKFLADKHRTGPANCRVELKHPASLTVAIRDEKAASDWKTRGLDLAEFEGLTK